MIKLLLFMAGLFFVDFASAAATCARAMEGKQSCISGETMKCVRRFDPGSQTFNYVLDGVNADGQAFSINTPMYKKMSGFTPAPCADANSARKRTNTETPIL